MIQILQGDCRAVLPTLEAGSVQMCVTSPPFWNLRDYGHPDQIGMEPTLAGYVANLVGVFREVKRVLRPDGTAWINLGDCFVDKQLQGAPWRVAFALQDDGWILRSDCIWSKPNVMPESVRDRPTKSHEYLFLLSKQERYFYDADAIRESHARDWTGDHRTGATDDRTGLNRNGTSQDGLSRSTPHPNGRNKRTVWTVSTQNYSGAHFATFPEKLIEPCILAGTSPQACEVCGAPWERVVERTDEIDTSAKGSTFDTGKTGVNGLGRVQSGERFIKRATGWQPTCDHDNAGTGRCIVLDPFGGSGTTARVAAKHQRDAILIELNPSYIEQAEVRTDGVQTMMLV